MSRHQPGHSRILLEHGAGGLLSARLIEEVFLPTLVNPALARLSDAAVMAWTGDGPNPGDGRNPGDGAKFALTTDSFVVKPLFFPGGDIGSLSVHGTVNDLAVSGARPLYLTAGFIIEEGFPVGDLKKIVRSMARAARRAAVTVVAGDTKVVEKGAADGLFINTSGFGALLPDVSLGMERIAPGDAIIVSGPVGDHGLAVISRREGLGFETPVRSDSAPVSGLVLALAALGASLRFMRDPTRGGLATTLKEIATGTGLDITVEENLIPVRDEVRGACDMLGLDPLYLANEGKLVAVCDAAVVPRALELMRRLRLGAQAALIGWTQAGNGVVRLGTALGGTRLLEKLFGEQLPRIC